MSSPSLKPGDWYCRRCRSLNFASRDSCWKVGCAGQRDVVLIGEQRPHPEAAYAISVPDPMIMAKLAYLEQRIKRLEESREQRKKAGRQFIEASIDIGPSGKESLVLEQEEEHCY